MAPRKAAKLAESTSPEPSPEMSFQSAATTAYLVPEIFENILRFADNSSLARLMRVRKGAIPAVARNLYGTTDYRRIKPYLGLPAPHWAQPYSESQTEWCRYICEAVTRLDVRSPYWLDAMREDSGLPPHQVLSMFRHQIMDSFIPYLKRRCPALRVIWLGNSYRPAHFSGEAWSISFDPPSVAPLTSPSESPTIADDTIRIDVIRSYAPSICGPPASSLDILQTPSSDCPVQVRFDLHLRDPSNSWQRLPPCHDEWLSAIRQNPQFGNLHQVAEFSHLPITLPDLTNLYQKQIAVGHSRLSKILAPSLSSWNIIEFNTFAKIASRSLTTLQMGQCCMIAKEGDPLDNLPEITRIVRHRLPNLTHFFFNIADIDDVEKVCGERLDGILLRTPGTLKKLGIRVNTEPDALFNTLRFLYSICAADVDLAITCGSYASGEEEWTVPIQQRFLTYLRKQKQRRRKKLCTVDFASLDVYSPDQVWDLRYHPDGRPQRLWETKAASWSGRAKAAKDITASNLIPNLQAGLLDLSEKSDRVQATMLAGGTGKEAHEEVMELVRAATVAQKAIDEIGQLLPANLSAQVAKYARTLEEEAEPAPALPYQFWDEAQAAAFTPSDSDDSEY